MAKYEIKHICGHVETVELQGSSESRQKKIAELESQICDDCYNAKKEVEFVAKAPKFLNVNEHWLEPKDKLHGLKISECQYFLNCLPLTKWTT